MFEHDGCVMKSNPTKVNIYNNVVNKIHEAVIEALGKIENTEINILNSGIKRLKNDTTKKSAILKIVIYD